VKRTDKAVTGCYQLAMEFHYWLSSISADAATAASSPDPAIGQNKKLPNHRHQYFNKVYFTEAYQNCVPDVSQSSPKIGS